MSLISKIVNKYKYFTTNSNEVVIPLPKDYSIEPTNYCNLECPACSTLFIKEKYKYLRFEEYKEIADRLPKGSNINFFHYGEPFLNPDMIRIIKDAKLNGFTTALHSNFNFKPKLIPEIAESGLDFLSASIDGASSETYSKFRIKGNFDLAWSNFLELAKLRSVNNGYPKVLIWQFLVNKYNEHEIPVAKKLIKSIPGKPRLSFLPIGFREEMVEYNQYSPEELEELKKELLPKAKKYLYPHYLRKNIIPLIAKRNCPFLWDQMLISVKGVVSPCCFTYKEEHSFGNIHNNTLEEIWNNEAFVSSRKMFLDKTYKGCNTISSRCNNYKLMGKQSSFQKNMDFTKFLFDKLVSSMR